MHYHCTENWTTVEILHDSSVPLCHFGWHTWQHWSRSNVSEGKMPVSYFDLYGDTCASVHFFFSCNYLSASISISWGMILLFKPLRTTWLVLTVPDSVSYTPACWVCGKGRLSYITGRQKVQWLDWIGNPFSFIQLQLKRMCKYHLWLLNRLQEFSNYSALS